MTKFQDQWSHSNPKYNSIMSGRNWTPNLNRAVVNIQSINEPPIVKFTVYMFV